LAKQQATIILSSKAVSGKVQVPEPLLRQRHNVSALELLCCGPRITLQILNWPPLGLLR